MRTSIILNDELMDRAMKISGIKTKTEIINTALMEYVERRERRDLSELRGTIKFADGYDHKTLREDAHL